MTFDIRPAGPAEVTEICALINRCEEHEGFPRRTSIDEVAEGFEGSAFDPVLDARSVYVGGQLVATARVWHEPAGFRQERSYLFGEVDPGFRGIGIGRALLAWQVERAKALLAASTPGLPKYVRASAYDFQDSAHRLYERFGLAAVRHFDEMIIPLVGLPEIPRPDGIEIVGWPMDRSEELRAAKNEAFADHWGSAPMNVDSWNGWMTSVSTRLDLSVVALERDTGVIAGHCVAIHHHGDEVATGRRDGWIDNVGTRPAWRGRGLAAAMILTCLHAFADVGFTHGALVVDCENETGAQALYRRLGFVTSKTVVQRELSLD